MSTHWFCHECGDGPLLIAHSTGCPHCFHNKCSGCTETNIYPKYSTGDNDHMATNQEPIITARNNLALANCSPPVTRVAATSMSTYCSAHTVIPSVHGYGNLSEPTDGGEVVHRWTCCQCYGDNSYDNSPGCTDCNDHWRCNGCSIYSIKY